MNFKALIYDMDGLLIDSMTYWMQSTKEFLAKRNIEFTPEIARFFTGKGVRESMSWLKQEYGLIESVEKLCAEKHINVDQVYRHECLPMPGADSLIKKAKGLGVKQAIATGAPLKAAQIVVERFGWQAHLDYVTAVDQVGDLGKPHPAVFLDAAQTLGLDPKDCVVFEDAQNGVEAAVAAGMSCVAIPDSRWSSGDFSGASLIAQSLEDEKIFKYLGL